MNTISVIIPTLNAGPRFAETLRALHHQQLAPPPEIIVIDSASTDTTLALAKKYAHKILAIPRPSFNHGLTRNRAIASATGDLIVLLSQDALPANPHLLANLAQNFSNPKVAAAYARHIPRPDHHPLVQLHVLEHAGSLTRRESFLPDPAPLHTLSPLQQFTLARFDNVCSCIRKSLWQQFPFPRAAFAEDLAWSRRVLESGHKIIYEPDALVIHSHDLNLRDYYRRVRLTHRALHQLFALQLIPRRTQIPRQLLQNFRHQSAHIRRSPMTLSQKWQAFAALPLHVLSTVLATYAGSHDPPPTQPAPAPHPSYLNPS